MKNYLTPFIQEMLVESKETGGHKTILSLAIDAYRQDAVNSKTLDSTFMNILMANLKVFVVAGHDTAASILSYVYYVLSKHPEIREAVRREHDAVFGPDPTAVTAKIIAVIKETLRLFPPIGTIRAGSAEFFLAHPDTDERYPTEGMMIFGCSVAAHRLDSFWPEPNRCLPERWLVPASDPLHPRKNAFRPFELGPRNCIGQEMAMLELRMILVMTVRDFDIDSHFPPDSPRVFGDLAFQTLEAGQLSAYPKDGMPAKVKMRKHGAEK
jgi:cytochrome P450